MSEAERIAKENGCTFAHTSTLGPTGSSGLGSTASAWCGTPVAGTVDFPMIEMVIECQSIPQGFLAGDALGDL
jgi:hypothetical protein